MECEANVYDQLNRFPYYIDIARKKIAKMVLDCNCKNMRILGCRCR